MSTCSGHPPPAEGQKALQVQEPSEGAPNSITQDLHELHKEKRYRTNSLTITTNFTKGAREQKGSRGQLALGEQPHGGAL